jgi:hypothetical protein
MSKPNSVLWINEVVFLPMFQKFAGRPARVLEAHGFRLHTRESETVFMLGPSASVVCLTKMLRGVALKDFDHKKDGSMLLVLMISPLLLFEEGADQVSPRCACYNTKQIREVFINFRRLPTTCNSEAPRTTADNLLAVLCLRLYSDDPKNRVNPRRHHDG